MPNLFSDTDFDTKVTMESEHDSLPDELPFQMLLISDWIGHSDNSQTDFQKRRPVEIDRDNFDEILESFAPKLRLGFDKFDENTIDITFTELDDFHPDNLFAKMPIFENLRDIRRRLKNPDTYNAAAAEVRTWFSNSETNSETVQNVESVIDTPNILDRILDEQTTGSPFVNTGNASDKELNVFIGNIVRDHIVQTDLVEQSNLLMLVDEVISDLMRKILHHAEFQHFESAWRSLFFLVRRIETGLDLKIYILHLTKDELTDKLSNVSNLQESEVYEIITRNSNSANNKPWAFISGNYDFDINVKDVALLMRMAEIAESIDVPFISSLRSNIFSDTFANSPENQLWSTVRDLPESSYLGLAAPGFLTRLPYGADTEPTENFFFEEFTNSIHNYLWSNACFACALLLAQTYRFYGWETNGKYILDIENLPLSFYEQDGESKPKPLTEIVLNETDSEKYLQQGIMPLISFRNSDKISLIRFQSIANPLTTIQGLFVQG